MSIKAYVEEEQTILFLKKREKLKKVVYIRKKFLSEWNNCKYTKSNPYYWGRETAS